jgi:hypothetical protein
VSACRNAPNGDRQGGSARDDRGSAGRSAPRPVTEQARLQHFCSRLAADFPVRNKLVGMCVRTIQRNKDGSVARYVQLAHNVRLPGRRNPVAQVIHGFGREEELDREALARLVRSISRFLEPSEQLAATTPAELRFLGSRPRRQGRKGLLTAGIPADPRSTRVELPYLRAPGDQFFRWRSPKGGSASASWPVRLPSSTPTTSSCGRETVRSSSGAPSTMPSFLLPRTGLRGAGRSAVAAWPHAAWPSGSAFPRTRSRGSTSGRYARDTDELLAAGLGRGWPCWSSTERSARPRRQRRPPCGCAARRPI